MNQQLARSIQLIPPTLPLLIAYITGVCLFWWLRQEVFLWPLMLCCALIGSMVAILLYHKVNHFYLSLMLMIPLIGALRTYQIIKHYATFPFEVTQHAVSIEGTLVSYAINSMSRFPVCSTILMHSLHSNTTTFSTDYTIYLYSKKKLPAEIADVIYIENIILQKPKDQSFYTYLMKEGIAATAFTDNITVSILSHKNFSSTRWLHNKREALLKKFKEYLNAPAFNLFATMFLGERTAIKRHRESFEEPFKKWGIIHYLARSGLHLVLILSIVTILLKAIPITFVLKQIILLVIIGMYFVLSWSSISFIRALCIFLLYTLGTLLRMPTHFLHTLLLCCFILLIINPLYIFFLDFQLSFGLTFALAWLNLFKPISPVTMRQKT